MSGVGKLRARLWRNATLPGLRSWLSFKGGNHWRNVSRISRRRILTPWEGQNWSHAHLGIFCLAIFSASSVFYQLSIRLPFITWKIVILYKQFSESALVFHKSGMHIISPCSYYRSKEWVIHKCCNRRRNSNQTSRLTTAHTDSYSQYLFFSFHPARLGKRLGDKRPMWSQNAWVSVKGVPQASLHCA